ncbi:enoyl-CoA hydratase/isomerase family protein, partial [bacterium]|nr:enoyl-CoA hydratase/isomerase family protein [candidate division CSSED10-310 bacterium]
MAVYEKIKTSIEAPIGIITIDNPPANALSTPVVMELDKALEEMIANDEVRAIILTGAGMFFIAGADIKEIKAIDNGAQGEALASKGQEILTKLETCPKPTIAAINGICMGGGLEVALGCDLRIAT